MPNEKSPERGFSYGGFAAGFDGGPGGEQKKPHKVFAVEIILRKLARGKEPFAGGKGTYNHPAPFPFTPRRSRIRKLQRNFLFTPLQTIHIVAPILEVGHRAFLVQ